jgi:hypothetical protein
MLTVAVATLFLFSSAPAFAQGAGMAGPQGSAGTATGEPSNQPSTGEPSSAGTGAGAEAQPSDKKDAGSKKSSKKSKKSNKQHKDMGADAGM